MWRLLKLVVFLAFLVLVGGTGFVWWYVTAHGFSARDKPLAFEAYIAKHARALSIPSVAKAMKNPLETTPLAIAEGRDHYADHCAVCHGNDGSGKTMINEGLYPPAPDMREAETQNLSDGEILYIIKNGIRFTGMPGWGGGDDENWKLVAFIRHLPKLSQREIGFMDEVNGLGPKESAPAVNQQSAQ